MHTIFGVPELFVQKIYISFEKLQCHDEQCSLNTCVITFETPQVCLRGSFPTCKYDGKCWSHSSAKKDGLQGEDSDAPGKI